MNDETSIKDEHAAASGGEPASEGNAGSRRLPEPVERGWFVVQERVIWPLQDRFAQLGPGPNRALLAGGALAVALAGIAVAVALSSGGGHSASTTATEAAAPRAPLASTPASPEPKPKQGPPRETLHGAAPVFSPPSPASKGGEKTGTSKPAQAGAASSRASGSAASVSGSSAGAGSHGSTSSSSTASSPSPASATISSDPNRSKAAKGAAGATTSSAAARAAVPNGPPAGPAALKVAREFAQGFVVYETGGEAGAFRKAFESAATPELTKALLQRPPKQPAGVKVPRAKVLNVVAGPSRGKTYEVSVSLLRVGVTSELRLEMEKIEHGKRVEWRVTNVLG